MGSPGRNLTGPRSPRAQRYQRRAVFAIRFRGDQNRGPASHSLIAGYMVIAFTSDIRGQQGGRAAPTASQNLVRGKGRRHRYRRQRPARESFPATGRDQLLGLGSEHGPRHGLHTDFNAVAGRVPLGLSAR